MTIRIRYVKGDGTRKTVTISGNSTADATRWLQRHESGVYIFRATIMRERPRPPVRTLAVESVRRLSPGVFMADLSRVPASRRRRSFPYTDDGALPVAMDEEGHGAFLPLPPGYRRGS